jgi:hypothetical protein
MKILDLFKKKQKTPMELIADRLGGVPTKNDIEAIYNQIFSSDRNIREWNSMTRHEQGELLRHVMNKRMGNRERR